MGRLGTSVVNSPFREPTEEARRFQGMASIAPGLRILMDNALAALINMTQPL